MSITSPETPDPLPEAALQGEFTTPELTDVTRIHPELGIESLEIPSALEAPNQTELAPHDFLESTTAVRGLRFAVNSARAFLEQSSTGAGSAEMIRARVQTMRKSSDAQVRAVNK